MSSSAPPAKRSITQDFTGDKDALVPLEKVDQLLTQPGSALETEVRLVNGRLTTVWKLLPNSVRDLWLFSASVSTSQLTRFQRNLIIELTFGL